MVKLTEAHTAPIEVRICPMRDGPCPHGWRGLDAGRAALEQEGHHD